MGYNNTCPPFPSHLTGLSFSGASAGAVENENHFLADRSNWGGGGVIGISHSGFKHKKSGKQRKTLSSNVLDLQKGPGTLGKVEESVLDRVTESSPTLTDGRIDYIAADGGW